MSKLDDVLPLAPCDIAHTDTFPCTHDRTAQAQRAQDARSIVAWLRKQANPTINLQQAFAISAIADELDAMLAEESLRG